jgi:hypothetical protein
MGSEKCHLRKIGIDFIPLTTITLCYCLLGERLRRRLGFGRRAKIAAEYLRASEMSLSLNKLFDWLNS